MVFTEWYLENAERMWDHLNGDEIAREVWDAAQFEMRQKVKYLEEENKKLRKLAFGSKVDKVIEKFNFEKVHKVMTALNWTWRDEGVPTVESLKQTARRLLEDAAINDWGNVFTGGFYAKKHESGELELSFIVTEAHSFEEVF